MTGSLWIDREEKGNKKRLIWEAEFLIIFSSVYPSPLYYRFSRDTTQKRFLFPFSLAATRAVLYITYYHHTYQQLDGGSAFVITGVVSWTFFCPQREMFGPARIAGFECGGQRGVIDKPVYSGC